MQINQHRSWGIAIWIRLASIVIAVLCSSQSSTSLAGPIISYPNFSSTEGLTLNGTAVRVGSGLQMIHLRESAGSAFVTTAQNITTDFHATFQFTISSQASPGNGADGLAFVIQADPRGASALGHSGTAVGYSASDFTATSDAIVNSVAITLRTYSYNVFQIHANENPGNVQYRTDLTSLYTQQGQVPHSATNNLLNVLQTVTVNYIASSHSLTVLLNGNSLGLDDKPLPDTLAAILGSDSGYLGFTAGAGSDWSTITFNSLVVVPEPSALALATVALTGFLSISRGAVKKLTLRSVR